MLNSRPQSVAWPSPSKIAYLLGRIRMPLICYVIRPHKDNPCSWGCHIARDWLAWGDFVLTGYNSQESGWSCRAFYPWESCPCWSQQDKVSRRHIARKLDTFIQRNPCRYVISASRISKTSSTSGFKGFLSKLRKVTRRYHQMEIVISCSYQRSCTTWRHCELQASCSKPGVSHGVTERTLGFFGYGSLLMIPHDPTELHVQFVYYVDPFPSSLARYAGYYFLFYDWTGWIFIFHQILLTCNRDCNFPLSFPLAALHSAASHLPW